MEIKTKFNQGDTVWFMANNKPTSTKLYHGFKVECSYVGDAPTTWGTKAFPIRISYCIGNGNFLSENILFKSKEELLASL